MRVKTTLISTVLFVTVCQIVTCLSHDFLLPDDVINDDLSEEQDGAGFTNLSVDDIEFTDKTKRAQLSLTGGLRSLADMVYSHGRRNNERSAHQNALLSLGKRNWRLPIYNFGRKLSSALLRPSYPSSVTRRRSQQLSVSGPLSALANMLAAEGRRRKQSESINNRMKLLELGKRSSETTTFDSNDIGIGETYDGNYL